MEDWPQVPVEPGTPGPYGIKGKFVGEIRDACQANVVRARRVFDLDLKKIGSGDVKKNKLDIKDDTSARVTDGSGREVPGGSGKC
jgi:hypothetical protein